MKNKKLAAGLGGVTAVAAAVALTAGTFAAFSDTETGGVVATAGTMDLVVGGVPADSGVFIFDNVTPGQNLGSTNLTFTNEGSVDGTLQLQLIEVTNEENGLDEPETDVDSSENQGELLENLKITVNGGEEFDLQGVAAGPDNGAKLSLGTLAAGTTNDDYTVNVSVPQDAGNEIQSDKASFKVQATLTQAG